MAIAFGTIGAKSTSVATATVDVPTPASPAAGDMFVAGRAAWLNTATFTNESGWSPASDLTGGTGSADDAHTSRARIDYKQAVGGESGNVTFDQGGTVGGVIGVMARYTKSAAMDWFVESPYATLGALESAYAGRTMGQIEGYLQGQGGYWRWGKGYTSGTDDSHGANRSITSGNIHLQVGDMLVAIAAVDTDTSLTITSPAFTAAGFTFGTTTRRTSGAGSTTGNDGNVELFDALVTAGSTTVIPITFAFTTATSQCGPVALIRLREVAKVASFPQSHPGRRVLTTLLAGGPAS